MQNIGNKRRKPNKKKVKAFCSAMLSVGTPVKSYRFWVIMLQLMLIVIMAAFAILAVLVKTVPSFFIDLQVTRAIQLINFPSFTLLMKVVSWPGFSPQVMIITVLIVCLIYAFGFHWETTVALVSAAFPTAINFAVKILVQRPRPLPNLVSVDDTLSGYSFPSGHVMFYLCFFGFLVFLDLHLLKPSLKRSLILIFFVSLIAMIGISRIYLGQHWASDVLGAYLLGCLILAAIIRIYLWGKKSYFIHK